MIVTCEDERMKRKQTNMRKEENQVVVNEFLIRFHQLMTDHLNFFVPRKTNETIFSLDPRQV